MSIRNRLLGAVVVAMAALTVVSCSKKINLTLHLKQGATYNQLLTTSQTTTQTIQGQPQQFAQTISMGYQFDVDTLKPDGSAQLTVTYRSVAVQMETPQGLVNYDSENPPDTIPPGAEALAALVGQHFTLLLSPSAEVVDVQGADRMIANMMATLGVPNDSNTIRIQDVLDKQFGSDAIKSSMFTILGIYPERPVSAGDSWVKTGGVLVGLPVLERLTYLLKNTTDSSALVEVNGTIERDPEAEPLMMGPMEVKYEISGTETGTMQLNQATGWITSAALKQEISGTMSIEASPQLPQGMSWPVTIHTEISLAELPNVGAAPAATTGADTTGADTTGADTTGNQ